MFQTCALWWPSLSPCCVYDFSLYPGRKNHIRVSEPGAKEVLSATVCWKSYTQHIRLGWQFIHVLWSGQLFTQLEILHWTISINISGTACHNIGSIRQKVCENIFCNFTKNIVKNFQKPFMKDSYCTHCKNLTKYFDKFTATFIKILYANFLLKYLKHYTKSSRNFI